MEGDLMRIFGERRYKYLSIFFLDFLTVPRFHAKTQQLAEMSWFKIALPKRTVAGARPKARLQRGLRVFKA